MKTELYGRTVISMEINLVLNHGKSLSVAIETSHDLYYNEV